MRFRPVAAIGVGLSTIAFYSLTAAGPAVSPSSAASAAAGSPSDVKGGATVAAVHLDALTLPVAGTLADANIAHSSGKVDGSATPRSSARASNLEGSLAGLALPNLLAVASQESPPDHAAPDTARSVQGDITGVASVDASTATAQARWAGAASCPAPGEPLTSSSISTADVGTAAVPGAGVLLDIPGTVSTSQSTVLAGQNTRRVVTTAQADAADVNLLGGAVKVAVASAPELTATATGKAGGASIDWSAPAVTVKLGNQTETLPADGSPLDLVSPSNPLLHLELSIGQVENVKKSADGTTASADASVLHLRVALGTGALSARLLEADLFPLSVSATAPAGGVTCDAGSVDTDGDGLTDAEETSGSANTGFGNAATDPTKSDTDGDGLSDGEETSGSANGAHGHAPTDPTEADTDGGGVKDGAEVAAGTDPLDAADDAGSPGTGGGTDTDGDGLTDQQETSGSENDAYGNQPTDPTKADTDGDGLSDGEETSGSENNGKPTDPNQADTDGDGASDGDEAAAHTDPTDPDDKPGGGGTGGGTDSDGDGLTDQQETSGSENDAFGNEPTDPNEADTDGGGVDDGDEIAGGTDPNDPDDDVPGSSGGATDPDNDGLDNAQEAQRGTDPLNPDTDGDGLKDGREVGSTKTDPTDPDTDGDGLKDGKEVTKTHTNPRKKDTDGDRLSDGKELKKTHTNPRKKDTDGDGLTDGREVIKPSAKYPQCHTKPLRKDTDKDGLTDGKEVRKYHTNPCNPDTDHGGISDGDEVKAGSDPLEIHSSPRHPDPKARMSLADSLLGLGTG